MSLQSLGIMINYFREKKKITQKVLGKGIGVHQTRISQIESGNEQPPLDTLLRIAQALELRPGLLMDVYGDVCSFEEAKIIAERELSLREAGLTPDEQRRLAIRDRDVDLDSELDLTEIAKLEQIRVLSEELINQKRRRFSIKNIDD